MESAFVEALKHYGAAALTIILLAWAVKALWAENVKNSDRFHEDKLQDIEIKTKMFNALEKLTEAVKS
jgi:hypothetical protein